MELVIGLFLVCVIGFLVGLKGIAIDNVLIKERHSGKPLNHELKKKRNVLYAISTILVSGPIIASIIANIIS